MFRLLQNRSNVLSSFSVVVMGIVLLVMLAGASYRVTYAHGASVVAAPRAATAGTAEFNEPDAGEQVITGAISGAKKSIWLEMYLLTDTNVIQALENAARSGLDVRVMLEPHPVGGGSPQSTEAALKQAGASVEDTSSAFTLTHEKGMIIDGSTAYIMSCNFTSSALNGKNREYGIIDTNPQDVQGVTAIFNADWNRSTLSQVSDLNLVVSPINSRSDLTTFINSAQHSLVIEAEELQDNGIIQAIAATAQRGVTVQVILPSPGSSSDSNASGIATVKAAGAQVREDAQLYMHAKMMVADGSSGYVGSENFSSTSLDSNRELGLLISDSTALSSLQQSFQQDWGASQSV
jgi:cardiolipin synthase A/B